MNRVVDLQSGPMTLSMRPRPPQDFFQVLRPRVRLLRLIKAPKKVAVAPGSIFYTEADFEAEHQLEDARLWADVMALQARSIPRAAPPPCRRLPAIF
jgi:hypothetical protein